MNTRVLNVQDIKRAFAKGASLTQMLREHSGINFNSKELIEALYDIQAGTYVKDLITKPSELLPYLGEVTYLVDQQIQKPASILDVGTGEMTTLTSVINGLSKKPTKLYAFDISWSRVSHGLHYAKKVLKFPLDRFHPFVAEIGAIPLHDSSVDIVVSNHALEPNRQHLPDLIREVLRVCRDKAILFEPCYESATTQGRQRMDRLGYIKNLPAAISAAGGVLVEKRALKNVVNPLNPTECFVIRPSGGRTVGVARRPSSRSYTVPGTNNRLKEDNAGFFSSYAGLFFPKVKGIPILKMTSSIFASQYNSKRY